MTETPEAAHETARDVFDPTYQTVGACTCGRGLGERGGHSGPRLIIIEVLKGTA